MIPMTVLIYVHFILCVDIIEMAAVARLTRQITLAKASLTQAIRQESTAAAAVTAAQRAYDAALINPPKGRAGPGLLMRQSPASIMARLLSTLTAAKQRLASASALVSNRRASLASLEQQLQALTAPPAPAPATTGRFARALIVGVNYVGTPYALYGCINDALNVEKRLRDFFPGSAEYRVLTDNTPAKPTRANILAGLDWLVSDLKTGENVFFHFSGHGGQVRDTNGDEVTGLDSCIFPCNDGRMEMITDDELRSSLAMRLPAGSKCFVVLDACHSGTGVDLRYRWNTPAQTSLAYSEDTKYEKTAGDIVFLSACMDTEYAMDTVDNTERPAGALTWALLDTWRAYGRAIKTKHLLWDIRSFLSKNGYSQIPQLSTGRYMDLQGVFDLGC
jgi:hypothetical protein